MTLGHHYRSHNILVHISNASMSKMTRARKFKRYLRYCMALPSSTCKGFHSYKLDTSARQFANIVTVMRVAR